MPKRCALQFIVHTAFPFLGISDVAKLNPITPVSLYLHLSVSSTGCAKQERGIDGSNSSRVRIRRTKSDQTNQDKCAKISTRKCIFDNISLSCLDCTYSPAQTDDNERWKWSNPTRMGILDEPERNGHDFLLDFLGWENLCASAVLRLAVWLAICQIWKITLPSVWSCIYGHAHHNIQWCLTFMPSLEA